MGFGCQYLRKCGEKGGGFVAAQEFRHQRVSEIANYDPSRPPICQNVSRHLIGAAYLSRNQISGLEIVVLTLYGRCSYATTDVLPLFFLVLQMQGSPLNDFLVRAASQAAAICTIAEARENHCWTRGQNENLKVNIFWPLVSPCSVPITSRNTQRLLFGPLKGQLNMVQALA